MAPTPDRLLELWTVRHPSESVARWAWAEQDTSLACWVNVVLKERSLTCLVQDQSRGSGNGIKSAHIVYSHFWSRLSSCVTHYYHLPRSHYGARQACRVSVVSGRIDVLGYTRHASLDVLSARNTSQTFPTCSCLFSHNHRSSSHVRPPGRLVSII